MPTDQQKDYKCLHCGCEEFITQPNQYDVYVAEKGKIRFSHSEQVNDSIKLFCRECSEKLACDDNDIKI